MKKFYKMIVFALVFAATMTTALLSPLSFRAADAIVFAETAASANIGATLTIKGMPSEAVVGQAVDLPSGSTGESETVVKAKVTNSAGRVVAEHSSATDTNATFTFTPTVAGNYSVVYTAEKNGKLTTTSDKFTLKVVQSSAEMEFADNSAFVIPAKVGETDKVVLPRPTVTEEAEVADADLDDRLEVTAKTEQGVAVALEEVYYKKNSTGNETEKHFVFTPAKNTNNEVITGNYTIKYKYNHGGYVATKTYTINVVKDYTQPTNLESSLASTFPTSAVLGNKLILPKANVVDKNNNNASVNVYTVAEVKFGDEAQVVDLKDLSFTPKYKATGTDKYDITYKMYDLSALNLADEDDGTKTIAEIVADATPVLTKSYTLSNVEDTQKPTVKISKGYDVETTEGVKTVAAATEEELQDGNYQSLMPSVVRVNHADVELPAIYAYDNYSSYGKIAAKTLTRTVKYNGNSYVLESEFRTNENLGYTQTNANEVALVTFKKTGTYEVVYRAEDGAGNVSTKTYSIKVKEATYTDDVAPYITLPKNISSSAKVGDTVSFSAPTVVDYEEDHKANPTSTAVVDAYPDVSVYYYLGAWTSAMGQAELDTAIQNNQAFEVKLVDGKYEFEVPETDKLSIVVRAEDHATYLGTANNVSFASKSVNIYSTNDITAPTISTDLSLTQQELNTQGGSITERNKDILVPEVVFDDDGYLTQSVYVVDENGTRLSVGMKNGQYAFTPLSAGTYYVTISATDRGGNTVLATLSFDVADISKLNLIASTTLADGVSMTLGDSYEIARPTLQYKGVDVDYEVVSIEQYNVYKAMTAQDYRDNVGKVVLAVDFKSYAQPGIWHFDPETWEFTADAVGEYKFSFYAINANGTPANQASKGYFTIEVKKSTEKPVINLDEDFEVPTYSALKDENDEYVLIKLPAFNVSYSSNELNEKGLSLKVTGPEGDNVEVLKYDANDVEILETDLITEVAYYAFKPTYGVGLYTVTYTATDKEGLSATETFNIKVGDTIAPTATGYTNPETKTWTVGDELSIKLSDITISDENNVGDDIQDVKGNEAINNTTGTILSIKLQGPNGEVSTTSTEDSIYVYKLDASGDYTLTYVVKDAAGNETEQIYNFTVKAIENNTTSSEKAWGIALVVLSVAILAGVIIYFVRTKDADATNLPSKKDDKKENK